MKLNPLTAISPIDGRYFLKTENLQAFFSEKALVQYRIKIEALYLIELSKIKVIRKLKSREKKLLISLFKDFDLKDAQKVKTIEKTTNHDVKAVEYFIKQKLHQTSLKDIKEYVHFALTSEDVNNLAYSLMIKDGLERVYLPTLDELIKAISRLVRRYKNVAMLSRTHGQPASPTTLGKELAVFIYRLKNQMKLLPKLRGKLNGAVGAYNAHVAAYPKINWIRFSKEFIEDLELEPTLLTTQIENHDTWAQMFHGLIRINNILIDFNRDIWTYISLDYLKQKVRKGEVGSSTMPHKVNPINFENSEGNLGIANSLLNHLANKLPISRLQRDLSDSTVCRNIGMAIGYCSLAFKSTLKGLKKISINLKKINQDLNQHSEVLTEAIQTILRREKANMPYEALKKLTRGKIITLKTLHQFIDSLKINAQVKSQLKSITPSNYLGLAGQLARKAVK